MKIRMETAGFMVWEVKGSFGGRESLIMNGRVTGPDMIAENRWHGFDEPALHSFRSEDTGFDGNQTYQFAAFLLGHWHVSQ